MEQLPHPPSLNLRQWVQVSAILVLAVMILISCLAVAQHLADAQFITEDELHRNIAQLESYTSEAQTLGTYTRQRSSLRTYTEVYSSSLQKAANSVAEKLSEHPHADRLTQQVATTIQLADSLSGQLQQLNSEPVGQLPDEATANQFYSNLQDSLQKLDENL